MTLASYDRLFPSQDLLPAGGVGNLIAAPLFKPARDNGTTVFLDLETLERHDDQWAYLSTLGRMTPQEPRRAADRAGKVTVATEVTRISAPSSTAKFIGSDLIANDPDPVTRATPTETERLREVIDNAVLYEQLGFDGFSVGERHHRPFLSSSPPVVLGYIAAKTSKIRLFTGVTLLSALDPVRVADPREY